MFEKVSSIKLKPFQMMRLMIARAIVRKPQILVFDDITSLLEAEDEIEVIQTI